MKEGELIELVFPTVSLSTHVQNKKITRNRFFNYTFHKMTVTVLVFPDIPNFYEHLISMHSSDP